MQIKTLFLVTKLYLLPISGCFLNMAWFLCDRIINLQNKNFKFQILGGFIIFYGFAAILINFLKSGQF